MTSNDPTSAVQLRHIGQSVGESRTPWEVLLSSAVQRLSRADIIVHVINVNSVPSYFQVRRKAMYIRKEYLN